MTKAELIRAMGPFGDDQHVFILLHSRDCPHGSQVIIHSIEAFPPWHGARLDRSNYLVGLIADADNSELRINEAKEARSKETPLLV